MFGLNLGWTEIIIVALVLVLLFGGKKIPEFIKGIGDSIKEFRKSVSNEEK